MHITSLHMKARVAQLVAMLFHDSEAIRFEISFPFRVSPEISPLQRTTFGMPEEKKTCYIIRLRVIRFFLFFAKNNNISRAN